MHFLPGISLLTLRRFVAEARWLFPVSRQKEKESGKQRNTEPWRWELNENAAFTEISATCSSFYRKYLSKSTVPVYCLFVSFCLFVFPFMAICWLFLFFVISPLKDTETGSKAEHSKNKWQNINCYKNNKVLCILSRFCFSNGGRCLSSLVRQK